MSSLLGLPFPFSLCPSLHIFKSLLVGVPCQSLPEPPLSKRSCLSVPTALRAALVCAAMTQVMQVSALSMVVKLFISNSGSVPLLLGDHGQVTSPLCFFIRGMTVAAPNSGFCKGLNEIVLIKQQTVLPLKVSQLGHARSGTLSVLLASPLGARLCVWCPVCVARQKWGSVITCEVSGQPIPLCRCEL